MLSAAFSHLGILAMRGMAFLPLPWLRALGVGLGRVLYVVAASRREVALVNLALCFPHLALPERRLLARQSFDCFACAWLDRSWLWHGSARTLQQRLTVTGQPLQLQGEHPVVVFAPHFVGMDAGGVALTTPAISGLSRRFCTIYTNQANRVVDRWMQRGRQRTGGFTLFGRTDGVKPVLAALRGGAALYLLPDMNFGAEESIFVPFYGIPAATVPSLSRFARLGRAQVVPVLSRMTRGGYEVQVLPAWTGFPSGDVAADTALMNLRLQGYIDAMPAQYYWVHKRFKSRPEGQALVY